MGTFCQKPIPSKRFPFVKDPCRRNVFGLGSLGIRLPSSSSNHLGGTWPRLKTHDDRTFFMQKHAATVERFASKPTTTERCRDVRTFWGISRGLSIYPRRQNVLSTATTERIQPPRRQNVWPVATTERFFSQQRQNVFCRRNDRTFSSIPTTTERFPCFWRGGNCHCFTGAATLERF